MKWICVGVFIPAGQIPILATTQGINYFSSFFQKKTKTTHMSNFMQ